MARSIWKGTLSIGLLSIPVSLKGATDSHDIKFNNIHSETCSGRIRIQNYCEKCNEKVEYGKWTRGYEYTKGSYVLVTDEDMESIQKPEKSTSIEIDRFVSISEVDPLFYEKSYFLAPEKGGEKAFALFVKALEQTNKAAVGSINLRNREHVMVVRPSQKGLVAHFLFYSDEVRMNEDPAPEIPLNDKEVSLAVQIINNLSNTFDPGLYQDTYTINVNKLIEAKIEGNVMVVESDEPKKEKVTDLMEALEKSVKATETKPSKKSKSKVA